MFTPRPHRTTLPFPARFVLLASSVLVAACAGGAAMAPAAPYPVLQWGPAPSVFPAGAQIAVVQGDPSKSEPFTVRLRFPNGYRIAPHTHPTDENVTVIEGTFKVGMGEQFDGSKMITLPVGSFVTAPALHAHYGQAQGATVVQVQAMGPFALTYINPADNPATTSH